MNEEAPVRSVNAGKVTGPVTTAAPFDRPAVEVRTQAGGWVGAQARVVDG